MLTSRDKDLEVKLQDLQPHNLLQIRNILLGHIWSKDTIDVPSISDVLMIPTFTDDNAIWRRMLEEHPLYFIEIFQALSEKSKKSPQNAGLVEWHFNRMLEKCTDDQLDKLIKTGKFFSVFQSVHSHHVITQEKKAICLRQFFDDQSQSSVFARLAKYDVTKLADIIIDFANRGAVNSGEILRLLNKNLNNDDTVLNKIMASDYRYYFFEELCDALEGNPTALEAIATSLKTNNPTIYNSVSYCFDHFIPRNKMITVEGLDQPLDLSTERDRGLLVSLLLSEFVPGPNDDTYNNIIGVLKQKTTSNESVFKILAHKDPEYIVEIFTQLTESMPEKAASIEQHLSELLDSTVVIADLRKANQVRKLFAVVYSKDVIDQEGGPCVLKTDVLTKLASQDISLLSFIFIDFCKTGASYKNILKLLTTTLDNKKTILESFLENGSLNLRFMFRNLCVTSLKKDSNAIQEFASELHKVSPKVFEEVKDVIARCSNNGLYIQNEEGVSGYLKEMRETGDVKFVSEELLSKNSNSMFSGSRAAPNMPRPIIIGRI